MGLAPDLALAQQTTPPSAAAAPASKLDVPQLFSTTCGWCHTDGGRVAGKGPQLMNTARSDDFIRNRIKNGKEGAMPAFGKSFSDSDIDQIIVYIRNLQPD
jgi:mono/diheme cytochrome c family protein